MALLDDTVGMAQIFEGAGLDNFEHQLLWPHLGMRRQNALQAINEIRLLQLMGADIDADRQLKSRVLPCLQLAQRFMKNPFAEGCGKWA